MREIARFEFFEEESNEILDRLSRYSAFSQEHVLDQGTIRHQNRTYFEVEYEDHELVLDLLEKEGLAEEGDLSYESKYELRQT